MERIVAEDIEGALERAAEANRLFRAEWANMYVGPWDDINCPFEEFPRCHNG